MRFVGDTSMYAFCMHEIISAFYRSLACIPGLSPKEQMFFLFLAVAYKGSLRV